ncbi:hypothetical protein BBJ28_00022275 [Nothophytophthora sp. Chile5]|nr:hypothetical protein BBJ28_00022275 [Nothophytophthora sp. Chile5]
MLRSLLRRHRAPVAVQTLAASLGRKPTARIPARGLSTAEGKPKSRSKWRTSLLLLATGLVGSYVYLVRRLSCQLDCFAPCWNELLFVWTDDPCIVAQRREPPELKEAKRLLLLFQESVQKVDTGDIEQALKYNAESFEASKSLVRRRKDSLPSSYSRTMILWTNKHAKLCQALGRHAAALPYYLEALEYIPQVSDVLERTQLHMSTLLSIASCYEKRLAACLLSGNLKASERSCKQAIDAYDQFQGQASLSLIPERDVNKRFELDVLAMSALTGYATLLFLLGRSEEISQTRKRVAAIVRGSPQLRSNEEELLDQFDDFVALEKMRVERHKQLDHEEGSDGSTI